MTEIEEWIDVLGWEGFYQVSNLARVRSLKRTIANSSGAYRTYGGAIRKQVNRQGYLSVGMWRDNKLTGVSIHRLVAIAFIPNPDNKPEINHINGIKTDNRPENLEWTTRSENVQHAFDTGLKIGPRGEKQGMSKLTEAQVLEIRASPDSQRSIAKAYNVSQMAVSKIKRNITWSHL